MTNNSGHNALPPDFYSDELNIMFDIYRVNDSEVKKSYNPTAIAERKMEHEIRDSEPRLALKLSPERNEELRAQFSAVTPAFHWNKKHWSDVYYEQLDDTQIEEWIKESYRLVASKLPKTIRHKYI